MGINIYLDLVLMPASLIGSFYLISSRFSSLYSSVCLISGYFCVWSICTYYFSSGDGDSGREYLLMGGAFLLLAITSYFRKRVFSIVVTLCLLGLIGMACGKTFSRTAEDLASELLPGEVSGTIVVVWGWMLRSYLMIHNILWGTIFGKFVRNHGPSSATSGGVAEYSTLE
mmetsp:Transcript_22218/g.46007  ORF Transcript_22218/g.46007 Transcript_22218/m.46007 type:complete len:171 (-) Transcript_22218:168-680(-)